MSGDQLSYAIAALNRQKTLDIIRESVRSRGYPPTITELAEQLRVSRGVAFGYLRRLEAEGHIMRGAGPRAITIRRGGDSK